MSRHLRCAAPSRRPSVSVVIPCYNYGHYLPDSVGSVLAQPGVDVDVVIVDDTSTDYSAVVAEELVASDPRVALIRHPKNRGHIATYNDGLDAVKGDYTTLLSADDLSDPGRARTRGARSWKPNQASGSCTATRSRSPRRRPRRVPACATGRCGRGQEWIAGSSPASAQLHELTGGRDA